MRGGEVTGLISSSRTDFQKCHQNNNIPLSLKTHTHTHTHTNLTVKPLVKNHSKNQENKSLQRGVAFGKGHTFTVSYVWRMVFTNVVAVVTELASYLIGVLNPANH